MKVVTRGLLVLMVLLTGMGTVAQAQDWSLVARINRAVDDIIPANTKVEKISDGFGFLEGPVWVTKGGYLLFSDIPANTIYKYNPADNKVSVFLPYSGFTGPDSSAVGMQMNNGKGMVTLLGSNGITVDPQGKIVYVTHGDHQVVRIETDGKRTVLAREYEGKRLNSPNDLIYKSNGSLYFTDPPAGLRDGAKDPNKALDFNGVYLLKGGELKLLIKDMTLPNGVALSPDEKYLYVNDSVKKIIMQYDVQPDDTIANGKVLIDMNTDKAPGAPDGMKVDQKGNIYCTGPGGFWIISPEGKHLGTILTSELPANLAFGGPDGKTMYLTARTGLYRVRLNIAGKPLAGS